MKNNHVLEVIFDSARTKADAMPEALKWEAEYQVFYAKLLKQAPDLADDFFDVCIGGRVQRGELMFMLAWELRGNPDKLFKLPDDN